MAKQEFSAMRISKNFTLKEFEVSQTAEKHGIDNRVPSKLVPNVKALVDEVLQPTRDKVEIPIHISSGYRCKAVNDKNLRNGASTTSQHMKGEAADIYIIPMEAKGWTLWDIAKLIVQFTDFDQLIHETRPNGSKWIHVSYTTKRANRHSMLRCKDGKHYYPLEI